MITKIQYNNYEKGEFTEEKERTLDETIALINNFPWQQQREHYAIGLTGPSITIQGPNNDFLKLAPYYHGKYVLHYLDPQHHLFTRSFDQPDDTISVIRTFFESQNFDATSFRKEIMLMQKLTTHFVTNDFHYTVRSPRVLVTSLIFLISFFFVVVLDLAAIKSPVFLFLALPVTVLLFGGIALFINHYRAAKDNVLIVSKGRNDFAYGPVANPKLFSKQDILNIVTYGNRGRDRQYRFLARVEINFMNGTSLELSCLLIAQNELVAKFPQAPQSEEAKMFPFIPRDSSAVLS